MINTAEKPVAHNLSHAFCHMIDTVVYIFFLKVKDLFFLL